METREPVRIGSLRSIYPSDTRIKEHSLTVDWMVSADASWERALSTHPKVVYTIYQGIDVSASVLLKIMNLLENFSG